MTEVSLEKEIRLLQQITIEDQFSRKNIRERVREDVMRSVDNIYLNGIMNCTQAIEQYKNLIYYESKQNRVMNIQHIPNEDLVIEIIIAIMEVEKPTLIQGIVTKLAIQLDYDDIMDGIKTASELFAVCRLSGLYDLWVDPVEIQSKFTVEPDTQEFINTTQYMMPSIVPMRQWTSNSNGGYITHRNSILLNNHHHDDTQDYEALNILQSIAWSLDEEVLKHPKEYTETEYSNNGRLLSIVEKQDQKKEFDKLLDVTTKVYQTMLNNGNEFYLGWRLCFRGRLYSSGFHINPQSSEYDKAALDFKIQEVITL